MGATSEALARQVEAKAREAMTVLEKLNDADWRTVTAAEGWTVGVTAHHLASAFEPVASILTAIASGQSSGSFSTKMLDEMNARHAKENADCTREETTSAVSVRRSGSSGAASG